ncbi:MAG: LysM peptidoglycan-binding domain-containing protein [Anaerolineales bacterium]|nr:LysM peptidoglycan-binding domain-containing protein [Anaerolineales bacterium]
MPPPSASIALLRRIVISSLALLLVTGGVLWQAAARVQAQSQTVHTVQPGENLFRIGLRYGVSWQNIMAANGLSSIYIYVGQRLIIPGTVQNVAATPLPAPPTLGAPTAPPVVIQPAPQTYTVRTGDTAWNIASRYGTTVSALAVANNLPNAWLIYAGQTLTIPGAGAVPAAPPSGRQLAVYGQSQALPLDCEARSAVDWAGYFGHAINEIEFFNRLPIADDPEVGFVGSAWGVWGQTPPYAYGVHAGPVAALLQTYGVKATAVRGLTWESIQAEIDAGRPVMVWVIGHIWNGTPLTYTAASTGQSTIVAAYEHTVIVTGYTGDTVYILDGATTYARSKTDFLNSWAVLGNMAIISGE